MTGRAEFLRTDDPPVGDAESSDKECASCRYWSRWLPETGDCLLYAMLRQEALLAAEDMEDFRRDWPSKCTRATSAHETCDKWTAREGAGLSR